jgi:hypothetical protein
MAAILANQNQVRAGAMEVCGEKKLRIGDDDRVIRIRGINVDYGIWRPVAALSHEPSNHSPPSPRAQADVVPLCPGSQ